MTRHARHRLTVIAAGIAAAIVVLLLSVAAPSHATPAALSDEDDCTVTLAARCTRG